MLQNLDPPRKSAGKSGKRSRSGLREMSRTPGASSSLPAEPLGPLSGQYLRLVGELRKSVNLLDLDVAQELPPVAVAVLASAVRQFLRDARLGLPVEGSSSSMDSGNNRYSRKLKLELTDPERAARVRHNREAFRNEEYERMRSRTRRV